MSFWRNVKPAGAIADFATVFREAGPARWRYAIAAALMTTSAFSLIIFERWKGPRPLPEVIYINSWPENRTEAETRAFIEANQKRKEAREAQQAKIEEETRQLWKTLGKVSGMDVDAIEKKARADEAAEKAKAEAALKPAPAAAPSENPVGN